MPKNKVVIFTSNNARIYINPPNQEYLLKYYNAILNPDLNEVIGVDPHYWKLVDGKIKPMSPLERDKRNLDLEVRGPDNAHDDPKIRPKHEARVHIIYKTPIYMWGILAATAIIVGSHIFLKGF